MKLPAVAMVAAFALGISLGLTNIAAKHAASPLFVELFFAAAATSLLLGILFVHFDRARVAAVFATICWILLGATGALIGEQPRKADHILSLASAGKADLRSPLRFYGRLRDEPEELPWGVGYEMELSTVEAQGQLLPASGGLRFSFTPHAKDHAQIATLHAGERVSVLLQGKLPQVYRDEGAFDRRAYLAQQGVDLVGSLRAPELLEVTEVAGPSLSGWILRLRRRLREEIDALWPGEPAVAGVMRAMLLGDRNFVDRDEAQDFQKTGAFHVLVVAGLHVGAIALALVWIGRKLRLPRTLTVVATLAMLFSYTAVVEQRTPVLRAVLMAAIVIVGGFFFRRLELLNSAAIAALALLVSRPLAVGDSSFQLSFLAVGCIGGLAVPWLEQTVQPYARALRGWRDVTRDRSHEPRAAQFRIDLRLVARFIEARLPVRIGRVPAKFLVGGLGCSFRVWELLVLTVVLQIGMLPLLATEFHRITFAGPAVNFAAVPLTAIVVPFGFVALLSGLAVAAVGKWIAVPLSWFISWLLHVVRWFAGIGQLSYRVPAPPVWLAMVFLVLLAGLAASFRAKTAQHKKMRLFFCGAIALATALVATSPFSPRRAAGKLEITVLDVGQGDSLFVVSPEGRTLLIDGGGAFGGFAGQQQSHGSDPGEEAVSPYLWSRGFKTIDVVALTHAHQDHLGGLNAILENFRVGQLWVGREASSEALAKLEALARAKHVAIAYKSRGESFSLGGVRGTFLWPERVDGNVSTAPKNNDSLVMRLKFRDETLMLPGDAEKQAEYAMLRENREEDLHAELLKIGHHGSKNSTTEEFLRAVNPKVAIISAGEDNPYGHPSPELLERLGKAGVRILRTDRDGAVHILTDGERLQISCFVACPEPSAPNVFGSGHPQAPDQDQGQQQ